MSDKIKIMIDCNIFDKLLCLSDDEMRNLVQNFDVSFNKTQLDEIYKISNEERKQKILNLIQTYNLRLKGWYGFAGSGCLGFNSSEANYDSYFFSEKAKKILDSIEVWLNTHTKKKPKENRLHPNRADAIFVALAECCGCIIVTEDGVGKRKGLIQAIRSIQGKVWSFDDLLKNLDSIN